MLTKSDVDILSTLPEIEIPKSGDARKILHLLKPIKIRSRFFVLDWAVPVKDDNLVPTPVLPVGQITNRQDAYVVVGLEGGAPFIDCIRIDKTDRFLPVMIPGFTQYFNTRYKLDHWDIADCCNDDLKDILLTSPEYQYQILSKEGTNSYRSDPVVRRAMDIILPDIVTKPTPPAIEMGRTERYVANGAEFKFSLDKGAKPVKKINVVNLAEVVRHFGKPIDEGRLSFGNHLDKWLESEGYDFLGELDIDDLQVVRIKEDKDVFANVYLGSVSSNDTPFILDVYLQLVDSKSVLEAKLLPDANAQETCVRLCALRIHQDMKYSPDIACTINKYLEGDDDLLTLGDLIDITDRVEHAKDVL